MSKTPLKPTRSSILYRLKYFGPITVHKYSVKDAAVRKICKYFAKRGYHRVYVVEETSMSITYGVKPMWAW